MGKLTAYEAWTEHRFFKYRGCAPDVDAPGRAAGNPDLSLDAWVGDDRDGGESQREREARQAAAKAVCGGCPVVAECLAYASSVGSDGKLLEPTGIRGGRTALERHRAVVRARVEQGAPVAVPAPAPDRMLKTRQKQAVLRALAVCWEPAEVMVRAELSDVRTANWQRSSIVTKLGLPKDTTRMRVLEVARERGLLEGVEIVPDDGTVPAIPAETRDVLLEVGGQFLLWPSARAEVSGEPVRRRGAGRGVRPRSLKQAFAHVAGQEEVSLVVAVDPPGDVCALFPVAVTLEAVA